MGDLGVGAMVVVVGMVALSMGIQLHGRGAGGDGRGT